MSQNLAEASIETGQTERKEFSITIDGVIDVPANLDPKQFFDGLLDTLIEYVERHDAIAGLEMSHKEHRGLAKPEKSLGSGTHSS